MTFGIANDVPLTIKEPMLEIRPNCECCDKDLPPESKNGFWRYWIVYREVNGNHRHFEYADHLICIVL